MRRWERAAAAARSEFTKRTGVDYGARNRILWCSPKFASTRPARPLRLLYCSHPKRATPCYSRRMTDPLRLRRIDHHSENGCWTLLRRVPPTWLRSFVHEIQGYEEEGGQPVLRKELPSGVVPMILVFGPGFALHDAHGRRAPRPLDRSFIAGLHESFALVGSIGRALCMQVDFTPLGARRFLGMEMQALAGQVADLSALIGAEADCLEERLYEARSWSARFAILERLLTERLTRPTPESGLVKAAWMQIEACGGDVAIGCLARSLGCSRKHLVTLFRREIGLPPKAVARVLRFQRAIEQLEQRRFCSLADLAISCGYADQAHFNRDFKKFAGEAPSRLLARMLPDGTGIIADPR